MEIVSTVSIPPMSACCLPPACRAFVSGRCVHAFTLIEIVFGFGVHRQDVMMIMSCGVLSSLCSDDSCALRHNSVDQ
jgi:hypothetical protein